jgi:hypothetical protein
METLQPSITNALRIISNVFDENEGDVNHATIGSILGMICEDVLEIVDTVSFQYAAQKLIIDKIVPIAHLIHEAFFDAPLKFTAQCPITFDDRSEGLYLGGSKHCISLKDALHFFFKNGLRRPDGGDIKEIKRVGSWRTEFLDLCRPIELLKVLAEIEDSKVSASDVADSKNAIIEDVEDGFEEIIEEIESFQDSYAIRGVFVDNLKHIATENHVYALIFD